MCRCVQGSPSNQHNHKNLTIQLKLDNEFELVFAVVVQKMLQLSYLGKSHFVNLITYYSVRFGDCLQVPLNLRFDLG